MKFSPAALVDHARSEEGRKKLRYVGLSVVLVPLGQALIQILSLFMTFTAASVVAAALLTFPNFFANKLFVWRVTSKENQRTQIAIFWVAAMLGVMFATGLTWVVEQVSADWDSLARRGAVVVAQLTGFGIVWVGRYLIFDRWLFRITHAGREPSPEEERELHHDVPI